MGGAQSARLTELDEAAFEAAADGDERALSALLDDGANCNHVRPDGFSPLMIAAQEGNLDCTLRLLECDTCELNRSDKFGYTACHLAAHWGNAGTLRALLAAGADFRRRTPIGTTPAHVAAARDCASCLRELLSMGADMESRTKAGSTVYDVAVESNSEACIALLDVWDNRDAGHILDKV
mmetsp:Transcript_7421/g.12546  ORF Transcript_7421/g.12546 Transcript_7421/m.12546 type:complete len:180 (-) Transcript_7421:411-950(-)|eukprot:CAMPEP_0119320786 /NCGR_PEP_ID=MMETSP1333-20130426/53436_1 /TAXON_ID=418940 /ORGANISM="Scyphosphaera apsteinii, Strain RCC1455" /LENGTH=179 /DNA_ID=CAMNT_0007327581 /DNA_START=94 /DNA_END=633 /DNA_ORIENTATION=-